jgi:hypothetical protein
LESEGGGGMSLTVKIIKPIMYHWAMTRAGDCIDYKKIQSLKDLVHWMNGTKHPTMEQLHIFADACCVLFGWMFLDEPPIEKLPDNLYIVKKGRMIRAI